MTITPLVWGALRGPDVGAAVVRKGQRQVLDRYGQRPDDPQDR